MRGVKIFKLVLPVNVKINVSFYEPKKLVRVCSIAKHNQDWLVFGFWPEKEEYDGELCPRLSPDILYG